MMESGFTEIELNIQGTLGSLRASIDAFELERYNTKQIADSIATNTKVASEGALLELGDGYWAHRSQKEAIEFYRRKEARLKHKCDTMNERIEQAQRSLQGLASLNRIFKLPEEGAGDADAENDLPIIEIQENLDEEGNVLDVKLNDKRFSFNASAVPESSLQQGEYHGTGDTSDAEQLKELLEDMELRERPPSDKTLEEADDTREQNLTPERGVDKEILGAAKQNVDTRNMLELELIANEVDHDDSDDDFVDYDEVIDDSSEKSDNTDSDSDEEKHYSLLPNSSVHHDRLWQEVQRLRNQGSTKSSPGLEKKVRFKEELEINEIENVGDILRNIEHEKQTVSRFKQNLILSGRSEGLPADISMDPHEDQKDTVADQMNNEVTTDIIEKPVNMESTARHAEPSTGAMMTDDTKSKKSRFKASRVPKAEDVVAKEFERTSFFQNGNDVRVETHPHERSTIRNLDDADEFEKIEREVAKEGKRRITSKFKKMINQNPKQKPKEDILVSKLSILPEKNRSPTTLSAMTRESLIHEPESSESETREMISAYNSGVFDDDLDFKGPIVNELKDFERLNSIIETLPSSRTEELGQKTRADKNEYTYSDPSSGSESNESDDDIMISEVIENDLEPMQDTEESNSLVEHEIFQRDLERNYYRLREKIYEEFGNGLDME